MQFDSLTYIINMHFNIIIMLFTVTIYKIAHVTSQHAHQHYSVTTQSGHPRVKVNIFKVVHSMYANAKSCVRKNGKFSKMFVCQIGVRQGGNLSPLLFAIFLNDFKFHMSRHYAGFPVVPRYMEMSVDTEEVCVLLRLWVILYADDTIILAKNAVDLQKALYALGDYCEQWKITVNVSKTKIIILSRGKIRTKPMFKINTEMIEVVDEFVYLGTPFSCNGSFKKAIKKQISQARCATYSLIAKAHQLFLPIDIVIQIYDQLVLPILLYGSEIWGFRDLAAIEMKYRTFLRGIMKLNKSTTNRMLYGVRVAYLRY